MATQKPQTTTRRKTTRKKKKKQTSAFLGRFGRIVIVFVCILLGLYFTVSCNKNILVKEVTQEQSNSETGENIEDIESTQFPEQQGDQDTQVSDDLPLPTEDTSDANVETPVEVMEEPVEIATEVAIDSNDSQLDNTLSDLPFDSSIDPSSLDNETLSWWFTRNTEHTSVAGGEPESFALGDYGAYYKFNTSEKVVCLTFDNGYEMPERYTETILDVLKANQVQGAFFVTQTYIRDHLDLVIRMKAEGHIVGNHTVRHKSSPELTDDEFIKELTDTSDYFEEQSGYTMDPFFRPPMGEYSERIVYLARKIGYRTIFWSLTYKDYDTEAQPGKAFAYQHVIDNIHPGAIPLLHCVSSSNTEALDDIIKSLKEEGYRFGTLYELE